jgi:uncharacterized membrane protein (DUF485 family)
MRFTPRKGVCVMPRQSDLEPPGRAVGTAIASGPAEDLVELEALAARRLRVALWLTGAMLIIYFGFILLVAFAKGFLGRSIADGLSVGILLGVLVILATWIVTWIYVRWANRHYEPALRRLRG